MPTTSPVLEMTSSKAAMKKLKSIMTGTPAPNEKTLWIEIVIGTDSAEFDCRETEHTGIHKNVTFLATKPCSLHFTNVALFRREWLELKAHQPEVLAVADEASNAMTEYCVYVPAQGTATTTKKARLGVVSDPKIVVPVSMSVNDPKIVVP
ncbi:MAG TPA: hypothetical protein VKQ11_04930 [Candidatus Sulfotelmatobacter sp.]|nr:hypothetical protein [Candidatus Sulfotelmatobacter sp.]